MSRVRWIPLVTVVALATLASSAAARSKPPLSGNPGPFVAPATSARPTTTSIPVSGTALGLEFGGVGAISGGGGNSRYLIDYPTQAAGDILDYLFKPDYGAALQILKVEIGGDANSTDGSEASVEHAAGQRRDCASGYEFWLMQQAKARNPNIEFYALAWTAPGWTGSFWSQSNITQIIDWLRCADDDHVPVDYIGGTQNETGYQKTWTESLRAQLATAGLSKIPKIAMADAFDTDATWSVADDLAGDATFNAATDVVADHDICGYPTNGNTCTSTTAARKLGKPLWASELGAMDGQTGAASMARAMIRGYPQAKLVSFIQWPLVSAMPPYLPHQNQGLIYARQPWSGNYQVNAMTYALAMMSWFTQPGWKYVDGAAGGFGGSYANGSYTTLRASGNSAWTTVAETTTTTASQNVNFTISGGLPTTPVHVWRTDPNATQSTGWMVPQADVTPNSNGQFPYTLSPGYIYTFTTVTATPAQTATPPGPSALGGYSQFEQVNTASEEPVYLADEDGAFQHQPCQTGSTAVCTQQMTPQAPVYWRSHPGFPYAVIGDDKMPNNTVSCDVLFTQRGSSAGVIDRYSSYTSSSGISNFRGYILDLNDSGAWHLFKNSRSVGVSILRSGNLGTAPGVGTWHHVTLTISGATLTGSVDGQSIGSATDNDSNYTTGIAGIEAGAVDSGGAWTGKSWPIVQYRGLTVNTP
jgi:Glycosyl hydrolase family 59/Concanavalin A-like lectin/glucanases superfamily